MYIISVKIFFNEIIFIDIRHHYHYVVDNKIICQRYVKAYTWQVITHIKHIYSVSDLVSCTTVWYYRRLNLAILICNYNIPIRKLHVNKTF